MLTRKRRVFFLDEKYRGLGMQVWDNEEIVQNAEGIDSQLVKYQSFVYISAGKKNNSLHFLWLLPLTLEQFFINDRLDESERYTNRHISSEFTYHSFAEYFKGLHMNFITVSGERKTRRSSGIQTLYFRLSKMAKKTCLLWSIKTKESSEDSMNKIFQRKCMMAKIDEKQRTS